MTISDLDLSHDQKLKLYKMLKQTESQEKAANPKRVGMSSEDIIKVIGSHRNNSVIDGQNLEKNLN